MNLGVDFLRHLFAVAVIAQHMASESRYSADTLQNLARVLDWVDGAVMGFFFLSGYLFKPPAQLLPYAKKQARRLLLPYFIFSTSYALLLAALGKGDWQSGLLATVSLRGAGMQLYYLPGLLLITTAFAALAPLTTRHPRWLPGLLALGAGSLALLVPTTASTGPDLRLLPLYGCAFLAGAWVACGGQRTPALRATAAAGALAVAVGWVDARFLDLAGVLLLFGLVRLLARGSPGPRLPGSGGVYLLHTPIINFAVSTWLLKASVTQGANIVASVLITYLLCLGVTLLVVRLRPGWRWALLE